MRITIKLLSILLCLFLIQAAARFGFSRMLARYAQLTTSIAAADQAVRLAPADPEAHRVRAAVLNRLQMPAEAGESLATACSLRYRDDYLWIELGNTREEIGDTGGALAAMDQAVRWAPHYAHTHWQRGNLLLRLQRSADAFTELRRAVDANPIYTANLIDLAWSFSGGDLKTTEARLGVKDDAERFALIRFLARKGRGKDVVDQIRLLRTPLSADKQEEVVRFLFTEKAFAEAFELSRASEYSESSLLINPGFEEPLVFNGAGFGWNIAADQKNRLAIDVSEKAAGAKSLQISFDGTWSPGTVLLSQTVVVKPSQTYRLAFAVRTKDLVTGGSPLVTISDASNRQLLAQSENFPAATTEWTTLHVTFTTLAGSRAVSISLQRSGCESSQCPIFGTLWLDEFSIEQTQTDKKS